LPGPLEAAKAAGAVRGDLRIEDVFLVLAMVAGAMVRSSADADRALTLALEGIRA
jgi:hypothetical protein